MNAQAPVRGAELEAAGPISVGVPVGPGWLAPLWRAPLRRLLDRIDARITRGAVMAILPDGSVRRLGGHAPGFEASVTLRDWRGLLRLAMGGSVGWYQAWEAGEWESPDPVALFALAMANASSLGSATRAHGPWRWLARLGHRLHRNSRAGSLRNIHAHYDLGNDFYAAWLDPTMSYSAGIFAAGDDLEAAQHRKIAAMADRVDGARRVLEIGCGWGSLTAALAQRGAEVTAISLSEAQLDWARATQPAGIAFEKRDYRDVEGTFDAIVSVEMVEAVGQDYWPAFFDTLARCLAPGGRAALQFITLDEASFDAYARGVDFIQACVFPGGMLVRESAFRRFAAERGFAWRDEYRFGLDYAETLRLWRERFEAAIEAGQLPSGFDHRFVRLWRYYLMYCEGGFRGGGIDVVQVTLEKA
jgi:cyclopropane-fatty-acyl-phospholipid synthase